MKDFTTAWKSSKQPRKQRKYRYNAPMHLQGRFLSAHLSKDLRKKHNTRSLRVRKGDKVKVLVGNFKGKSGKVEKVDVNKSQVFITGIDVEKKDGSKSMVPINASNLIIEELVADKKRLKAEVKK